MRRKDREMTDIREIEEFISQCRTCRIAMIDGEEPYVIPMNFGYRGKKVYLHGSQEGRKMNIFSKGPKVCVEWDKELKEVSDETKACNWTMKFASVIAWGEARILSEDRDKKQGLEILMEQFSHRSGWEYDPKLMKRTAVIEITLDKISGKINQ